jgi:hypothetical protein
MWKRDEAVGALPPVVYVIFFIVTVLVYWLTGCHFQ